MHPDRIVIGTDSKKAAGIMEALYGTFGAPIVITDIRSSEMIKYACNTYLATRISFINEIAEICERVDADITSVIQGMKYDKRIGGHYLSPGPGFGGPCLSKDIKSLINFGNKSNANVGMLKAVLNRNEQQIKNIAAYIHSELEGIRDKRVAVFGLSFKAGTNDIRNSPALELIEKLSESSVQIHVFDPIVKSLGEPLNTPVKFYNCMEDAAHRAHCAVIMTEWEEFKRIDLEKLYLLMDKPLIVDTRNILPAEKVRDFGFIYKGMGIRSRNHDGMTDLLKKII